MTENIFTRIGRLLVQPLVEPAPAQKALYDLHPELLERIPIMRSLSDEVNIAPSVSLVQWYNSNPWVYKAIKVVSDAVCRLDIDVVTDRDGGTEAIETHPLHAVLNSPNPATSAADFWREWTIRMLLQGEVGNELVRNAGRSKLLEMWNRAPETITIKPGPMGMRYADIAGYKIDDGQGQPYNLLPDELILYKFYNPLNPWRGISPLSAVRMGVIIDALAQAWTRLFFKNQARPDYAVIAPEGLTKTEKDDMLTRLSQQQGGDNVHRPIILEEGVTDIKVFSFPPKDIEWLEQRKMSRDEVGAIYGVPDEIMGYGKDTYENYNTADRVLWTLTIVPLVQFRDGTLTHRLRQAGQLAPTERIETDLSDIPQLREDITGKVDQLDKLANRGYPINVLNEWLDLGLPPVPGGDVGFLPVNVTPVEEALKPKPAPGLPGVSPQPQPQLPPVTLSMKSLAGTGIPYGSPQHVMIHKYQQSRLDKFSEELRRMVKDLFQQQQSDIDRKLRASKEFGRGRYKANLPPIEQLFDPNEWAKIWANALDDFIEKSVQVLGQQALDDVANNAIFHVDNPLVRGSIRALLEAVSVKTNNTTWQSLTTLFQEAEAAGESIPAIQERLALHFGEIKEWRSELIARTTMTGAANLGSVEAWKQSGVVEGQTWISALIPGRTRDDHAAAHNQSRPLGQPFDIGGEALLYPGDPAGSPGQICNCLCTTIPEVIE